MKIRVVIADDHTQVRTAVAGLLEEIAAVELIGSAVNGEDAVRLVTALKPDLLLLDLVMPRLSGFDALPRVRHACPGLRVIILSMHCSAEHVRRALALGAVGFLRKDTVAEELEHAIAAVMNGGVWLSPAIAHSTLAAADVGTRNRDATSRDGEADSGIS